MNDETKKSFPKGLPAKIIIPALILAVVVGIWVFKNYRTQDASDYANNPDFALHATKDFDLEQLKSYGIPIMLDFGADYCDPCKKMAPTLKELNRKLQGKAIIKYIDIMEYQKLAQDYPVMVIPTQVFFDSDGNPFEPSDPEGMRMNIYSIRETGEHVFTTHEGGMTEEMILDVLKEMGLEYD